MNRDVGQTVKSLLKHVVFWVDTKWKYPKAASTDFKNFNWLSTLAEKVFGGLDDHQRQASHHLLQAIWKEVEYDPLWKVGSTALVRIQIIML